MIPALEHPDIRPRALPISVRTYHWMQQQDLVPRRAELICGVIVEKMSKSPAHTGLTKKQVERFTNPVGDRYAESRLFSAGEMLTSTSLAGFSLPLASLFA